MTHQNEKNIKSPELLQETLKLSRSSLRQCKGQLIFLNSKSKFNKGIFIGATRKFINKSTVDLNSKKLEECRVYNGKIYRER